MLISKHLHLDMSWYFDILLHKNLHDNWVLNTLSSLKALALSLLALSNASMKFSSWWTILIPFPPPPMTALIKTGNPIVLAYSIKLMNEECIILILFLILSMVSRYNRDLYIYIDDTLAFVMIILDWLLEPISRMASAGGPTNIRSFYAHWSAKSAFSERNPNL